MQLPAEVTAAFVTAALLNNSNRGNFNWGRPGNLGKSVELAKPTNSNKTLSVNAKMCFLKKVPSLCVLSEGVKVKLFSKTWILKLKSS